jgi:hypothetical protein
MDDLFKRVRDLVVSALLQTVDSERRRLTRLARIRAAVAYVKGVSAARLGVGAVVGLVACCMVLFLGLALLHAALFVVLPWSLGYRVLAMAILGLAYVIIALSVMAVLLSEKRWMQHSGASEMVEKATSSDSA